MEKEFYNIEDLHIALYNPRFELIDKLNFDFIESFKIYDKKYTKNSELNAIIDLYNEDTANFEELFRSVSQDFYSVNEKVQLIKLDEHFIVIEGNRRISCLKIINNIDVYLNILKEYHSLEHGSIFDTKEDKKKNSFFKFLFKIKDFNLNKKLTTKINESNFTILENNEDISNSLFKKHLSGETIGYQPWNKGKYFFDIWKIFVNENWKTFEDINKNAHKINKLFNTNTTKIWNDYKESCFIIQFLNKDNDLSEEEIRTKIIEIKPTAFQTNFISTTLKGILQNIDKNIEIDKYYKIDFIENKRVWRNQGEFDLNSVFHLMEDLYFKKMHSTRLKLENIEKMKEIFYKYITIKPIYSHKKDFLDNFLKWSLNDLEQIQKNFDNIDYINDNTKKLVNKRIDQYNLSISINDELKKANIPALNNLIEQIIYNSKTEGESYFINAIQSAIRTICEYIMKIIIFYSIENYNKENEYDIFEINNFEKEIIGDDKIYQKNKKNKSFSIKYDTPKSKEKLLISLLTDYSHNFYLEPEEKVENFYSRIFKNILSSKLGKLEKLNKLKDNLIFINSMKSFFKKDYYKEFIDFLNEYFVKTHNHIHKTYLSDFDKTINYYEYVVKEHNQILKKFIDILRILNIDFFRKYVSSINDKNYSNIMKENLE